MICGMDTFENNSEVKSGEAGNSPGAGSSNSAATDLGNGSANGANIDRSVGTSAGTQPPSAPETRASSKRGLIIALVALVIVIAVGFIAYNALSAQSASTAGSSSASAASSHASNEASAGASSGGSSDSTGEALPRLEDFDATIYDEYGDARTLTQLADGKPFVMNFWATWCPFCVQEMDDYQAIVNDYEGRVSFAFIDVADGSRETVDDAAKWLFENGYTLPAYYDTTLEATYAYGAQNLPTTVIVAANGDIMDVSPGKIDPALMRQALDSLLAGASAPGTLAPSDADASANAGKSVSGASEASAEVNANGDASGAEAGSATSSASSESSAG